MVRLIVKLERLALTLGPTDHQFIARLTLVDHLARGFRTGDQQAGRIEQADLNKDGSLVPINMFMNQLIAFELDDTDGEDFDYPSGRWDPGQKPVYLRGVSKLHDKFIHEAVGADCAADGNQPEIGRIHPDEMILVKTLEMIVPDASSHCGNVVDVRFRHHRCHSGIDISGLELVAAVRFPKRDEVKTSHIVLLSFLAQPAHRALGAASSANPHQVKVSGQLRMVLA